MTPQGVRTGHAICSPYTSWDLPTEGAMAECRPLSVSSPALPPQAFHVEGWAGLSWDTPSGAGIGGQPRVCLGISGSCTAARAVVGMAGVFLWMLG